MNLYYVILTEWNYPTESGHDIYDYYDEILNISLLSIFNVYQVKTFSERSQTR